MYASYNFQLVMSLGATLFFGDRFCTSKKSRTGGGGWVHPKAASGRSYRKLLVDTE